MFAASFSQYCQKYYHRRKQLAATQCRCDYSTRTSRTPTTIERIGRLAGLIEELRDETTLVVLVTILPGVLAMVTEAEQALAFFQAVEPDAGRSAIRLRFRARARANWFGPLRSRGFVRTSIMGTTVLGSRRVVPWTILEAGTDRVGLFGVIDPNTPSMPRLLAGSPSDQSPKLERPSPNSETDMSTISWRSHTWGNSDDDLAAAVDIDAILGGHIRASDSSTGTGHCSRDQVLVGGSFSKSCSRRGDRRNAVCRRGCTIDRSVQATLHERWEQLA